jgi:hypothetical protein
MRETSSWCNPTDLLTAEKPTGSTLSQTVSQTRSSLSVNWRQSLLSQGATQQDMGDATIVRSSYTY